MHVGIHVEPEGCGYDDLLAAAVTAEESGFDSFSRSDHYFPHERPVAPLGPTDAWLTLAALARETNRITLSTLMNNASFRHPSVLAVSLSQIYDMCGGRLELGMGAGWFEREARAFGFEMPVSGEDRLDRRAEQIAVVRGIWGATPESPFSFAGRFYSLDQNPGLGAPKTRPFPHLVLALTEVGRSYADAVAFADEANVPFQSLEATEKQLQVLDEECARQGRDPETLARSVTVLACVGNTEAEVARRAGVVGLSGSHTNTVHLVGSPKQVLDDLRRYVDLGISRMHLQVRDATDLDLIRLLGDLVADGLTS